MDMNQIILKKRNGDRLLREEIEYVVKGYTEGTIPDYQVSALLMAIFFQKMDQEETFQLTEAMRVSGDVIDLSAIEGVKVDKHSTGGVGDKVTLVVAPIVAACGVPVAKMSGRGLGFTGGTIDKLESIPGFKTSLEPDVFFKQVNSIGIAVIGQTAHVAPADKKFYALRDVTGTVDNLSLISSSIMSKKLASGSDAILLDVKCGHGAFMENFQDAKELGQTMCKIGENAGKKTVAAITDMSQPLGSAVGNSLEVIEAIETLKGRGPKDIEELSLSLAGIMIYLGGHAQNLKEGKKMAKEAITSGRALIKMREFIKAQGGDNKVVDNYEIFPTAKFKEVVRAEKDGYVKSIDARQIGIASQMTGAGRATKEDQLDLSAGVKVLAKVGQIVQEGQVLLEIYSNERDKLDAAMSQAKKAFKLSKNKVEPPVLIKEILGI